MTSDLLKTLVAEYRFETDALKAGQRYDDICRHIDIIVLDKCRAVDKLYSLERKDRK